MACGGNAAAPEASSGRAIRRTGLSSASVIISARKDRSTICAALPLCGGTFT